MTPCGATQHDTANAYKNHGCRCDKARRAHRQQTKLAVHRRRVGTPAKVPALGTRRRLQALSAIGWDIGRLSMMAGVPGLRSYAMYGSRASVSPATANAVQVLYERLSMTCGPSVYARRAARVNGWPAPLAWDDDIDDPAAQPESSSTTATDIDTVAVERVLDGERLPLNPAEQAEVARQLLERGQGVGRIGDVLHVNGKKARRLLESATTQKAG